MTAQDTALGTAAQPAPPALPVAGGASRWPVTAVFFLNGLTLSTYIIRIPALKDAHHLSTGELGAIGMLFAAAALVAMQFVGPLVTRIGVTRLIRIDLVALPLSLVLIGAAGGLPVFAVTLVLMGALHGTLDVAMNSHAVTVERRLSRPILSGCHAAWSISAVVGSLAGAVVIHAGVAPTAQFAGVAAVVIVGGLLVGPLLGTTPVEARQPRLNRREQRRRLLAGWRVGWTRTVLRLGLTGTALMVCDGAAYGWSAIYLHDNRGASLAVASLAVTGYTAAQTAGRVVGDGFRRRFGDPRLFTAGAIVGTAGYSLAVFGQHPASAIAGFAICGLGTSVLVPMIFSAVGHEGEKGAGAATFVSRFTTLTYAGILLGPAVIGWVAEGIGLTWTLALLVPMLATVAAVTRLPDSHLGS